MDDILPVLYDVRIDVNHPVEPGSNGIFQVKQKWEGVMALVGNVPIPLLPTAARKRSNDLRKGELHTLVGENGFLF